MSSATSGKLSFAVDVYTQVIRARCASCHNDAPAYGGLAFSPDAETAYSLLVNAPAGSAEDHRCRDSGLNRVEPGAPDKSLLYLKLTTPPCGGAMPPMVFPQPTPEQIDIIRQWILDGAAP